MMMHLAWLWLACATLFAVPSLRAQVVPAPPAPAGTPATAPTPVPAATDTVDAVRAAAGANAPVDPNTYQIGPDDVLQVSVWRVPEVSGLFSVRPDGKITMQLIGDVPASGMTPVKLGEAVRERLLPYYKEPIVTVGVQHVLSKKYTVTGKVRSPGSFPLTTTQTIVDALTKAGGPEEWGNDKKIVVVRGTERLKFNFRDFLKGKNIQQNIPLQSGDIIIVP